MADETICFSPAKTKSEARALGLNKYFTGKPCKRGHLAERYVAAPNCIECMRLSAAKTKDRRREYHRDYLRRYYADPVRREHRRKRQRERDAKRRGRKPPNPVDPQGTGFARDDSGVQRKLISRAEAKAQGLPRYFTGKRCKNGHVAERYTACGCVICARANGWIWKSAPGNLERRRFRDRERKKKWRRDPIKGPVIRAQNKASAKKHAPKWRAKMLHKLAGSPKPEACEICRSRIRICFDHCHASGKFRGWICNTCNSLLGIAKDNPDFLRALAAYLERPPDASAKPIPRSLRREAKRSARL